MNVPELFAATRVAKNSSMAERAPPCSSGDSAKTRTCVREDFLMVCMAEGWTVTTEVKRVRVS